jgi:hypothetical protein
VLRVLIPMSFPLPGFFSRQAFMMPLPGFREAELRYCSDLRSNHNRSR